jgi:arylsulfatase A-like enzyme
MRITPRQRLDDTFMTLAECFREAGYRTAAFVSTPALNRTLNLTQGFDVYEETFRIGPEAFEITTDWAIDWLGSEPARPALLWAHFNNAHVPYVPPPDLRPMFVEDAHYDASQRVAISAATNELAVDAAHPFAEQLTRGDLGGVHPQFALRARPNELAYYVAQYDAAIYWADRCIGKLLDAVATMPEEQRPIVALVGDHGESLGEHNYYFEHGRLPYDNVLRVPLILRLPEGQAGAQRVAQPIGAIDLMPTLLEVARVRGPAAIEGRSLVPLLHNNEPRGDVFFAAGYQLDFITGVRRGAWKLTHVPNEMDRGLMNGAEYELYDLSADPGELDNLYERREDVAGPLRQALHEWSAPWWDRAITATPGGPGPQIDEQTLQKLKELGYLKDDKH